MITREVIDTLYKTYHTRPKHAESLDMALLFDSTNDHHNLAVDLESERLTIGSVSNDSPFKRIAMRCIHAIVPFEEWVAIVMHSSIIFLNRESSRVAVHLKPFEPSIIEKVRYACVM
jgi:hypothetical protein